MREYNFPFTIADVAGSKVLGLTFRRTKATDIDVDCPFCYEKTSKKKGKMNLNLIKNAFRCNNCDKSGGVLVLYADIHGISTTDALREIKELLGCDINGDNRGKATYSNSYIASLPKECQRANPEVLHQTYTMLLNSLLLAKPHKKNLLERGLNEKAIEANGYKSVPGFGQKNLCLKLIESGCVLKGVPGFYKDENKNWMINLKAPGILVPVRTMDGKISGIQIRMNNPLNGRKYIWLSSNGMESGTGSGSPIHFVGDPTSKRVFITEGPLKGDVAHFLSLNSFICIPGVNAVGMLDDMLLELKNLGACMEIIVAFDMDKTVNPHVAAALEKLNKILQAYGFVTKPATWENKALNGIDDYYLWRWQEKQKTIYSVDIAGAVGM